MQYEVEGNDFAPWKLPSAHSYQLDQGCNERLQSTSFLMTKESFTAMAQELPPSCCRKFFYLRYVQAGKDIINLLHEIRGSFNLRQRISSEDEIYKCSP